MSVSAPRLSRIRIAIVDDHPIFRDGLKHLLESDPNFEVVAEGSDGMDANRIVRDTRPDVLLLDFAMPTLNGVDTLEDLPRNITHVILLTAAIDAEDVLRAIQLGARGVILKESPTRVLVEGIHRVMDGGYVIGSEITNDLAHAVSRLSAEVSRPFGLTPRELEIAAAIADGASNRELAERLTIGLQTVKHHLASIFIKTGVSTRLELALFVIDHGLAKRGTGRTRALVHRADRDPR